MADKLESVADPLAASLAIAARLYGEAVSPTALAAGLPLEDGRMTPALVVRAAERAGLQARIDAGEHPWHLHGGADNYAFADPVQALAVLAFIGRAMLSDGGGGSEARVPSRRY